MEPSTSQQSEKSDVGEDQEETAGLHAKKRRRWRPTDPPEVEDGDGAVDETSVEDDGVVNSCIASNDAHTETPTDLIDSDDILKQLEASGTVVNKDGPLARMIRTTEKLRNRPNGGEGTSDTGRENAVTNDRSSEHSGLDVDDDDDDDSPPIIIEDSHDDEDDDDDDDDNDDEHGEDIRMEEASSGSETAEGLEGLLEGMPKFSVPPTHRYQLNHAIRARQMGRSTRLGADWFVYRFMGSLHAAERLELMSKLEGHNGCVNCLSFNYDGTKLASGSDDTNVVVWDWAAERPLISFDSGHTMNVFQAKFMPLSGDCHMVTCARDGQVRLAELSVRGVCKSTRRLARHTSSAHKLALDANSPHVFLSCGEDAAVFEIDLRTAEANKILTVRKNDNRKVSLYSVNFNPSDGNYFCASGRDSYLRIFDRRRIGADGAPVKSYCPHHLQGDGHYDTNITAAVYNHNGTELLATYNDDDIYTFDTSHSDGADYTHRYMGHRNNQTVKGVNYFGPKSEFIVSGSDCGNVFLWDHDSEKIVQVQFADEGGVVNVLEGHPYAAVLATSGLDHDVKLWVPSNEKYGLDVPAVTKLVTKNCRMRERDRRDPDPQADFIYLMLRRIIRQRAAERQRADGDADADGIPSDSDDSDEETGSDMDEDAPNPAIQQCRQS